MHSDVLVIGAGPTGMMLASELALAGVPTVLADKLPRRSDLSRAGGVQSRTLAALDQRGLLEPLLANGDHPVSDGHFAGIPLYRRFARHRPWRSVPQVVIEEFLEKHLATQDIQVQREHELTALGQDGDGVTASFANGVTVQARYLVAADGAHSTVRSLLGAEFPGRPATATVVAADVRLAGADEVGSHNRDADGHWAALFPLGLDPRGLPLRRLVLGGPGRSLPREVPVTEEEIREGLRLVFGSRVRLLGVRYARRITNTARLVTRYRHGRVFLAGDAAHVHLPLGAQGMNTGMQDAVNLGWKLGAAVHGWAPEHLLDTYHPERHPVAAAVLRNVAAQSLLMDWEGTQDPDVTAVRELFADLARLPEVQRHLIDLLSGMAIRYPMPGTGTHPLVGLPAPDLDLGPARVNELLRSGRGVLLDPADALAGVAGPWSDRVDRVGQGTDTEPVLIRPDGYVGWAGGDGLEPALAHWFGAAR